jgi:hypothetical protein
VTSLNPIRCTPQTPKPIIGIFVFIDDFLGSGDQFSEFFREENLNSIKPWYPVYSPLVAHQEGIRKLKAELPQVRVCTVEILSQIHNLFDSTSRAFGDGGFLAV